jgi:hypothetical protein
MVNPQGQASELAQCTHARAALLNMFANKSIEQTF